MGLPQATKRLLPDFLIPHCVIRLDHVIEASRNPTAGTEAASTTMGCLDPRTAGKHLSRLEWAAEVLSLSLAETVTTTPQWGALPEVNPDLTSLQRSEQLLECRNQGLVRGGSHTATPDLRHLLQAVLWNRISKKPMTFVSERPPPA